MQPLMQGEGVQALLSSTATSSAHELALSALHRRCSHKSARPQAIPFCHLDTFLCLAYLPIFRNFTPFL